MKAFITCYSTLDQCREAVLHLESIGYQVVTAAQTDQNYTIPIAKRYSELASLMLTCDIVATCVPDTPLPNEQLMLLNVANMVQKPLQLYHTAPRIAQLKTT